MRYGIMSMQLDALIPPGMPADQVMANVAGFNFPDLVRKLFSHGFNPIELGGDLPMFLPHTFSAPVIQTLAELKEELGVSYTLHLPLWSVEPSTPLAPVRIGSVEALLQSIHLTLPLEPEVYVLHAFGALASEFYKMSLPTIAKNILLKQFQSNARQSIQVLLSESCIPGRKLAIETIEFPYELTLELAEELDLSICFDTGHVLVGFSGPVDFFEALEGCLPRLAEVHLHDAPWHGNLNRPGYGLDHHALGEGDLEVERLLQRLERAGFQGPLIYELRLEQALASMEVIRNLRPQLGD
jgi:sugar phosphate isomerase/epimerase